MNIRLQSSKHHWSLWIPLQTLDINCIRKIQLVGFNGEKKMIKLRNAEGPCTPLGNRIPTTRDFIHLAYLPLLCSLFDCFRCQHFRRIFKLTNYRLSTYEQQYTSTGNKISSSLKMIYLVAQLCSS